jgi:glycosyltransferase involved in cell wall biosynthesis
VRILFIADHDMWPLDSGIAQRNYHLATGLARRHDVTLVMMHWAEQPLTEFPGSAEFAEVHCVPYSSCQFYAEGEEPRSALVQSRLPVMQPTMPDIVRRHVSAALGEVLASVRRHRFDAVWVTRGYFAEQVLGAGLRNVIVDLPDLHGELGGRVLEHRASTRVALLQRLELNGIRRWERSLAERFAAVVVCKSADVRAFGPGRPRRVHVVGNGIDPAPDLSRVGDQDELLFVGTLHYEPNVDAVRQFHDRVLPLVRKVRPFTRLVIVGRRPPPDIVALHDGSGCVVRADVADLVPHYERAGVVIVPLRLGSGTRIKTMEALAHGKAVVSTAVGVEGIDVRPGRDLLIGEPTRGFARACIRLLGDPALREHLGRSGRDRVRERHRWEQSIEGAERVLSSVAADC